MIARITIRNENFKIAKNFYLSKLKEIAGELGIAGHIVIKLGDKTESQALNYEYLKRDYPTDVLSFPCKEALPDGYYLGDIFICFPVAVEQAAENNNSIEEELLRLMIHGILHLAGCDHETDEGEMNGIQDKLVGRYFSPGGK